MKKLSLIIVFGLSSCNVPNEVSSVELRELQDSIIATGDAKAYITLIRCFADKENYYQLLPYSMHMAMKYDNADAYYQLYYDIIKLQNSGKYDMERIRNLDADSREFVISCLRNGAKKGDRDCQEALSQHYRNGWGLPKNIEKADSIVESF